MRYSRRNIGLALLLLGLADGAVSFPPPVDDPHKEVGRTTERELNVVLSSSFGSVYISKGGSEKILTIDGGEQTTDRSRTSVDYSIRNRIGYANISFDGEHKEGEHKKAWFNADGFRGDNWSMRFTDAVPISFDIELGVGTGQFDLSGLQVKDFNLSTGASDVEILFDQPNKANIDNLNIESGLSKFEGRGLGNANFKHFRFQGGVGVYTLDFGGKLEHEVDVDIEVGFGVVTIVIPKEVGAKITCEKNWASRLDCDRDFQKTNEDQYVSGNYPTATGKMNIRVTSGLGSVKVRR